MGFYPPTGVSFCFHLRIIRISVSRIQYAASTCVYDVRKLQASDLRWINPFKTSGYLLQPRSFVRKTIVCSGPASNSSLCLRDFLHCLQVVSVFSSFPCRSRRCLHVVPNIIVSTTECITALPCVFLRQRLLFQVATPSLYVNLEVCSRRVASSVVAIKNFCQALYPW